MNIVVFGGTTEGRVLSHRLAEMGHQVTVCVATGIGQEEQGQSPGIRVKVGRLDAGQMAELLHDAALCVDATHPYAVEATKNICQASEWAGVEYHRLLRCPSPLPETAILVPDAAHAVQVLENREGNVLLTTGSKDLPLWEKFDKSRLFVRVLPTHDALTACERIGLAHRNIMAMEGPFSTPLNEALLKQWKIRYLITKDSGAAGGFAEKCAAAAAAGAILVVLSRPKENGETMEQILRHCRGNQ